MSYFVVISIIGEFYLYNIIMVSQRKQIFVSFRNLEGMVDQWLAAWIKESESRVQILVAIFFIFLWC